MAASAPLDGPHWSFSLAVYGEADVASTCLYLQNEFGVDVNILLLVAWVTVNGNDVGSEDIALLDSEVGKWRDSIILPIRSARNALKNIAFPWTDQSHSLELRKRVLDIELAAEQIEQAAIATWLEQHRGAVVQSHPDAADRVRQAILRVVDHFQGQRGTAHAPDGRLESIVSAACRHGTAGKISKGGHHA